jgi:endonuclease/exonuclease/phosphatase family metal-dependent hydrolase
MGIDMKSILFLLLLCSITYGCGTDENGTVDNGHSEQQDFLALSYNVAGLPEPLSSSQPSIYIPQISPLLNSYDLVLVQEDFWYHNELSAQAEHPYESESMWEQPDWFHMGDGLNRFSVFPLGALTRITWIRCSGFLDCSSDCLTTKGFSVSEIQLAAGISVDVYNLHMDAGSCDGDIVARRVQTEQLVEEINIRSSGKAVIVAGDTNLKFSRPDDRVSLDFLLLETGLQDACRFLECGNEIIDRIMFRSSDLVSLTPLSWELPQEFIDAEGNDLSDHMPVSVRFSWEGN